LASLEKLIEEMEELAAAGRPFEKQDRRFHEKLFSGVPNQVFHKLSEMFWIYAEAKGHLVWKSDDPSDDLRVEAANHRRIFEGMRDGRLDIARQALWASLEMTQKQFQAGQK